MSPNRTRLSVLAFGERKEAIKMHRYPDLLAGMPYGKEVHSVTLRIFRIYNAWQECAR